MLIWLETSATKAEYHIIRIMKTRVPSDHMERDYSSDAGNLARELLRIYPDAFGESFEDNKILVKKYVVTDSKSLRNEIAGQITRLKGKAASSQLVGLPYVSTGNEGRRRRRRTRRR